MSHVSVWTSTPGPQIATPKEHRACVTFHAHTPQISNSLENDDWPTYCQWTGEAGSYLPKAAPPTEIMKTVRSPRRRGNRPKHKKSKRGQLPLVSPLITINNLAVGVRNKSVLSARNLPTFSASASSRGLPTGPVVNGVDPRRAE